MGRWTVAPDDFLKGTVIPPGFYPSVIVAYSEEIAPAKTLENGKYVPESMYLKMEFKIVEGQYKGVVLYGNYSEKAKSMLAPLVEALSGVLIDRNKQWDFDPSREKFINKTVDIHVIRGSYNNKPKNEIDGYKKFSGKVPSAATAGV